MKYPQAPQEKYLNIQYLSLMKTWEKQAAAAGHNVIIKGKDETVSEPKTKPWTVPRMWHLTAGEPVLWMQSPHNEACISFQALSWAPGI